MIIDPTVIVADYVIQVSTVFRPKTANILGSFHVWKKGGWFGNADELMKFCPAMGCKGLFSDSFELPDEVVDKIGKDNIDNIPAWPKKYQVMYENWFVSPVMCPECGQIEIRENLPDTYGFNMEALQIGERMAEFFSLLGGTTDVYMVRTKEKSLFHKAKDMLHGSDYRFSEYKKTLEQARERDCVFYPLKSIINDTTNGSDLARRFKALLEA